MIQTDMTAGVASQYDRLIADGLCVQPRWGYPEDVGRAVAALARGDFPYSVAGLRECRTQHYGNTPRPVWNPDVPQPIDFLAGWAKVPEQESFDNAFKVQWEAFLRHIVTGSPFPWSFREGAKGVQLAELGL